MHLCGFRKSSGAVAVVVPDNPKTGGDEKCGDGGCTQAKAYPILAPYFVAA
jgi:hypothetical protein